MTDTIVKHPVSRQIVGLDLLRFAAAMSVVTYHSAFYTRLDRGLYSTTDTLSHLAPIARYGWVGVQIFFLLSGFVIAYSAENATASAFLQSRILRLYPAAWICATITLAGLFLAFGLHAYYVLLWLLSITLSPFGPYIDPSYWTLGLEMVFYGCIYALLKGRKFNRLDVLCFLLTAWSTVAMACMFYEQRFRPVHSGIQITAAVNSRIGQLLLLQHGVFFSAGATLWLCLFQGVALRHVLLLLGSIPAALLSILNARQVNLGAVGMTAPLLPAILIVLLACGAIILSVKANHVISAKFGHFGMKISRTLGLITYPLYLLHQQIGSMLMMKLHSHLSSLFIFILTCGICLILATAIATFIEPPLREALRHILDLHRKSSYAPAASLP